MKKLNVTVICSAYYNSSIQVPDEMSLEEAIKYAKINIDKIPLGEIGYISDSRILDEENCNFDQIHILGGFDKMKKCSELVRNTQVVFKIYSDIHKGKIYEIGSVIYVLPTKRKVCVSYLEGHKARTDGIPYEDMVACYDKNGKEMSFDNIHGKGVLLLAE